MDIKVVAGKGTGKTILSAFDAALKSAGVYNYNLICLSSIIPPNSKVQQVRSYNSKKEEFGYKLYVVKAELRSKRAGNYIAAGVGWYPLEDGSGLFVEHELEEESRMAVELGIKMRIKNSLEDLCKFRDIKFDEEKVKSVVSITQVKGKPTCALVLAVYKSEGWN